MFHREPSTESINHIESASRGQLLTLYFKIMRMFSMCNAHLWFNSECKKKNVNPNYIHLKTKSKTAAARKALKKARSVWLKEEIKTLHTKRYFLNLHLKHIHCVLAKTLHPIEFDIIDNTIREKIHSIQHKTYIRQKEKLNKLIIKNSHIQPNSSSTTHLENSSAAATPVSSSTASAPISSPSAPVSSSTASVPLPSAPASTATVSLPSAPVSSSAASVSSPAASVSTASDALPTAPSSSSTASVSSPITSLSSASASSATASGPSSTALVSSVTASISSSTAPGASSSTSSPSTTAPPPPQPALIDSSTCRTTNFYQRLVNFTNIKLTPEEETLLGKGLSFSPYYNKPNNKILTNLAVDLENAFDKTSSLTKYIITSKLINNIKHHSTNHKHFNYSSTIKSLKHKIETNNLIITKADKGNTVTILDKSQYRQKINDFLSTQSLTILKTDPTPKYQKTLKKLIENCPITFPKNSKYKLVSMNPQAPILYGLPKIHKPNVPIRPIVSYNNAPTNQLCRYLSSYLPDKLKFFSSHSLKNSLELIEKIKHVKVHSNCILVSFDVVNLYPSVPIPETKSILKKLISKSIPSPLEAFELENIINLCLDQSYFLFDGKYYKSSSGLPMGSPISCLISNIFMSNMEENILNTPAASNHIKFWYRYVDDIICLWSGSRRQLSSFLNTLNSLNPSIQFTMEIEQNNSLNFLDLSISRKNSSFSFNIYRKPTYTDIIIPADSMHPHNIKMSVFFSLFHRLTSVPLSEEDFRREKNTIFNIGKNNGYPDDSINKVLKKVIRKKTLERLYATPSNSSDKNYRKIQFIPHAEHLINHHLTLNNTTPAFYNNSTLRNMLTNNKLDKRPPLDKSGVYELGCQDCDCIYVGQTGRSFAIRIKEHLKDMEKPVHSSSMAEHAKSMNHSFTPENCKILHVEKKGPRLDLLESLEIHKALKGNKNIVNEQTNLIRSPFFGIIS